MNPCHQAGEEGFINDNVNKSPHTYLKPSNLSDHANEEEGVIPDNVNKGSYAYLKPGNLSHHAGEEGVAGDVEGHAKTHVR